MPFDWRKNYGAINAKPTSFTSKKNKFYKNFEKFLIFSLSHFQLLPRLTVSVMLEIERILDNKPIRPPMISTLQMRGLISHGKYFFSIAMQSLHYICIIMYY